MKIHLTKDEKTVFRSIVLKGNECPAGITGACYFLCVVSLQQKGLVEAVINYNEIIDVKASYIGIAYFAESPALRNPIDWYRVITTASIIITALATALALFVACRALKG
ncbi:MAG: hypothetical protein LBJ17_04300 [Dysgonamonadaceae bacterium]|jgi:hypothetical protein|nr:hypothetical protein [Dysgonamonadaceae bacterium]